jgi:cell wall-associated NlpC family hydrolase
LGICFALLAAVPAFADPSISSKRAEAQQVMSRLQQLSDSLERARAEYDASTRQLAKIQRAVRENRHELRLAKHNLKRSQVVIAQRLVTLYTSDQASTLEVVLGARSLDDMISRMDSAKSVTSLDARVLAQVKVFRRAVKRNGDLLAQEHAAQERVVARRAAAKQSIQTQIGQSNSLLSSIRGQIAQMVAAEAARQRQLAAAAQQRLELAHRVAQQQAQDTVVGATAVAPAAAPSNDTTAPTSAATTAPTSAATSAPTSAATPAPAEAPVVVAAPPSTHGGAAGVAMSQLGTPYVWGGASPGGFDCSGLVMWAYAQAGVSLPHSSYAQYGYGVPVSRDQLQAGDLVFFDGLGHVGIYIGGDQFVHAPHTGDVVKISSLSESWYASTYVGARRIL